MSFKRNFSVKKLWNKYSNSKLIQQTGWAISSKIFAASSFYIIYLFLVRSMSVERFGQWTLFLSYFFIFKHFGNLGMHLSVKYFFAQNHQSHDFNLLVNSSLKLRFVFSLLFSIGLGLFLLIFPRTDKHLFQLSIYLVTLLAIFFYTFSIHHKAIFEGLHQLKLTFHITGIEAIICVITIFLFYSIDPSFESIILGYAFSFFIASSYGFFRLLKLNQVSILPFRTRRKNPFDSKILRYSFATFLLSICTSLATEVDTLMINYLTSDYETGIYGAAKQLLRYLPHISMAIAMGTLPAFAVITPQKKASLAKKFRVVFGLNLSIFLGIALLILILGPALLPWAIGDQFSPSLAPLFTLLPYVIFHAIVTLTSNLINYWGMAKVLLINQLIFFGLNVALNFLLIPSYGAMGAGISTSLSILPYLIINLYWVKKKLF